MRRIAAAFLVGLMIVPGPAQAGNCDCEWQTDAAGRRCGKRAAEHKPGGANPMCNRDDAAAPVAAPVQRSEQRPAVPVEAPRRAVPLVRNPVLPVPAPVVALPQAVEVAQPEGIDFSSGEDVFGIDCLIAYRDRQDTMGIAQRTGEKPLGASGMMFDQVAGRISLVLTYEEEPPPMATDWQAEAHIAFLAEGPTQEVIMLCGGEARTLWDGYGEWSMQFAGVEMR